MVGSGFKTKGLDRALLALHSLNPELLRRTRMLVIGQDNPKPFLRLIKRLKLEDRVEIMPGSDEIPAFLLAADLLIHPAYSENTGTVLLEAVVAGLPVLTTAVCGYAHFVERAGAGCVLPSPFDQQELNSQLQNMLTSPNRENWRRNALNFSKHADIYSLAERAVEIIEKRIAT